MEWKTIKSEGDLSQALEASKHSAVAIFKHSTRCPTSFMAKRQLESDWNFGADEVTPYFLDLIAFRSLSHAVSQQTGIDHESPQLILMADKKVIYHASHGMISTDEVRKAIAE